MKKKSKETVSEKIATHWVKHAAIERICGDHEGTATVDVEGEARTFKRNDNFDYFLVNTDEFLPLAPKGSVVEIYTCDADLKPGNVVLVAGNKRMEIRKYAESKGLQILGQVTEVKHWPGKSVCNYCL